MGSSGRSLRSGYTTGACAAAAAKAAVRLLRKPDVHIPRTMDVDIPFPDGSRHVFAARWLATGTVPPCHTAAAMVVKDAGDDPDVTNGAQIVASARLVDLAGPCDVVTVRAGEGVGQVTKPGLSIRVGEPAITPAPKRMILEAVAEELRDGWPHAEQGLEITISVPGGEALAKKTLNARLGIKGGLSILGTTGIVRPLSAEAWTSAIAASLDVAAAVGHPEVALSVGRASERAHMRRYGLAEEAYVMMGDYFEFSLVSAAARGFRAIHVCAQWAKMLKISMSTPETHVRRGALDVRRALAHLRLLGLPFLPEGEPNTARELYDCMAKAPGFSPSALGKVVGAAKRYAMEITGGAPVKVHLVSYEGDIIVDSEEDTCDRHRI